MLVLKKKGVSRSYRLFDGDSEVSLLRNDGSWSSGSVEFDGSRIEFSVANDSGTAFAARVDEAAVSSASWPNTNLRAYDVEFATTVLHMTMNGIGQKPFDVTNDAGESVGVVALRGATGRRIEIDLPDDLPAAVRLLCGWLATRSYNQAANVRIVNH